LVFFVNVEILLLYFEQADTKQIHKVVFITYKLRSTLKNKYRALIKENIKHISYLVYIATYISNT